MLKLGYESLKDRDAWLAAGVIPPDYDPAAIAEKTKPNPIWMHFGAGNIFRAYIAALHDKLLSEGRAEKGIIAVETHDPEIIDAAYAPFDNLCISVTMAQDADGSADSQRIIGSVSGAYAAARESDYSEIIKAFENPSLQFVSFTITEKAYVIKGADGEFTAEVAQDLDDAAGQPKNIIVILAAALYARYKAGGTPIALVSMDNCGHNGERLRAAVLAAAEYRVGRGFYEGGFLNYISDQSRVSFPWSMIDKITPWPSGAVAERLAAAGIADMSILKTKKGVVIAPFVNAEATEYLVVEDKFPNGRPPLEKAGVIFTDQRTVDLAEKMKVTTCLNPLHTALAIFGVLFGYKSISAEMKDPLLLALIKKIGYDEGLPVVLDPGVINPKAFIDEVIQKRFTNPMIPDTPQRIATDTSQKIPVRYGETVRAYLDMQKMAWLNQNSWHQSAVRHFYLTGIPLAFAGWLRYLLCVDDELTPYAPSADPMLETLRGYLKTLTATSGVNAGPDDVKRINELIRPILSDRTIFGVDLYEAGIAEKVLTMFVKMLNGPGSVRKTLTEYLT